MAFDLISYLLGKANKDAPYQPVYDGLEYETGEWIPTESTDHGEIRFTNTHTKRPTVALVCTNETEYDATLNTNYAFLFVAYEDFASPPIVNSDNTIQYYAQTTPTERTTNASGMSNTGGKLITKSYTDTAEEYTADYQQFYVTNEAIKPYTGANTRTWKANTKYKWVAIWM